MNKGTIVSGIGHAGLIIWMILGDFLFSAKPVPEIAVTEVSLMSAAEYDAMVAAVPSTSEPATPETVEPEPAEPEPAEAVAPPPSVPEPVIIDPAPELEPVPEPEPTPEPEPVPEPEPMPEPELVPEPITPPAEVAQPIPVPPSPLRPLPRPADRVAPLPVDVPEPQAEVAPEVTPALAPEPAPEAEVVTPPKPAAAPEAATTQIITEAVKIDEAAPQLAPTSSPRPKVRPKTPVVQVAEPAEPAEPVRNTAEDAVAAALAEAMGQTQAEPPTQSATRAPSGPPMTAGEKDALRVAVQACWNVGSLSSDALRVTVTVGVSVAQSGVPEAGSIRMIDFEGGPDAAARQAFEAARRAIIRCGASGFKLPSEKYDQWRDMEMVFNPEKMRIK